MKTYCNIYECLIWPLGQAVKTPPSHGGIRGSIPLEATKETGVKKWTRYLVHFFVHIKLTKEEPMTKAKEYEARTEELLLPIIEANQFELVDVEYVKEAGTWYLRAYIDKPGGITIDDCELVSRSLNEKIDEEDYIPDAYILEVSSPGLDRPLKKDKDFARSLNKEVEGKFFKAVDGQKEFVGVLKDFTKETVTLEMEDQEITVDRKNLALIRLYIEF